MGLARNGYNVVGIVAGVLNTYMMNPLAVSLAAKLVQISESSLQPSLTALVELERASRLLLGEFYTSSLSVTPLLTSKVCILLRLFGLGVFPITRV